MFESDYCGNGTRGPDEQCDGGPPCNASCELDLCGATPGVGCGTIHTTLPEQSTLTIKDDPDDSKDQLKWKWKNGTTPLGAFGTPTEPTASASYVLCVYDGSADPQPILSGVTPAGGVCGANGKKCWSTSPSGGLPVVKKFSYNNKLRAPDGVQKSQLQPGTGKAQLQVQGKGFFLEVPPLQLDLPVTVEVRNTETSDCWQATYDSVPVPDRIIENSTEKFQAKSN